jgi:hypothetical protein
MSREVVAQSPLIEEWQNETKMFLNFHQFESSMYDAFEFFNNFGTKLRAELKSTKDTKDEVTIKRLKKIDSDIFLFC